MHRTEGANNVANFFANGPPGTRLEEDWLNAIQEEIAYVIEQEGIPLKTAATETTQQLNEALRKAFAPIPTGTIMLFGQTVAPVGWTRKDDWQDNAMLCYAAAGAIGSGGAVDPQTAHTHTTGDHTLIIAEMPAHVHGMYDSSTEGWQGNGAGGSAPGNIGSRNQDSESIGGDGAHNHGATGANGAPHYQEVIAAVKD